MAAPFDDLVNYQIQNAPAQVAAGSAPLASPAALPTGGLLAFDLPAVFRCAVELGAAVNGQADGVDNREADIAGERLLQVLNPRRAEFPGRPDDAEHRLGWKREVDLADASPAARQALLTLALALADLRGEPQWHGRGRELLSAGTWNLWDGMGLAGRTAVRRLLPDTHRLWGWPADPAGEPGPFSGPKATLSDPRILAGWRTVAPEALMAIQESLLAGDYLVESIQFGNGRRQSLCRYDVRPSSAALPSICPKANPKLPIELCPTGDLLADIEARYRSLKVIGEDESLHWVGRQASVETTCTCDLTTRNNVPRPPEWHGLRQLRRAIRALVDWVGKRALRQIGPDEQESILQQGERVAGLTRAAGLELPRFPELAPNQGFRLYGPACVPVNVLEQGEILVASEANVRAWASEWRAVRVAADAQLAALDPCPLPCQAPTALEADLGEISLQAPAGTPTPLREAFEAVAESLFQGAQLRRCPPANRLRFEEVARQLAAACTAGRERYAAAELLLQAAAEDGGSCALQEALNAVCRVNEACGEVMRGIVPLHRATAHILAVPTFHLVEMLKSMRRQTSRAAMQLRRAEGNRFAERLVDGPDKDQSEGKLATTSPIPRHRKRSTERGEGRAKLIAALTKHHQYADGGCLNLEAIGNNELAKAADVSSSTASAFFNAEFQGYRKYKILCQDAGQLVAALKLLNNEFAPHHLLGAAASDLTAPEQDDADSE